MILRQSQSTYHADNSDKSTSGWRETVKEGEERKTRLVLAMQLHLKSGYRNRHLEHYKNLLALLYALSVNSGILLHQHSVNITIASSM